MRNGVAMRRVVLGSALSVCLLLLATSGIRAGMELSDPIESPVAEIIAPQALALADLNADSRLDAVVVGKTQAKYGLYLGKGDGFFGPLSDSGPLNLQPTDFVLGDFNGDGLLDLISINSACTS
jgi:hypothetical protein